MPLFNHTEHQGTALLNCIKAVLPAITDPFIPGSEGSGLPYVATGDPVSHWCLPCVGPNLRDLQFWVARTAFRHRNDQVSQGGYGNQGSRLGGGAAASLKAPSKLVVNTPSLSSLPLKSHVSDISGELVIDSPLENGN